MSASFTDVRSSERRRFLKLFGLAGLTSMVSSAMLSWAEPRTPRGPAGTAPPPAAPADSARAPGGKPPEISDDARALAGIIERRYGKHLRPKQLEAVAREIESRLQGGTRLREARLANSDEPDVTFRA